MASSLKVARTQEGRLLGLGTMSRERPSDDMSSDEGGGEGGGVTAQGEGSWEFGSNIRGDLGSF